MGWLDEASAAAHGAAEGLTFGMSDKIVGAINATAGMALDPELRKKGWAANYEMASGAVADANKRAEEEHGTAFKAGEYGSMIVGGIETLGIKGVEKAASLGAKGLGKLANSIPLGKVAKAAEEGIDATKGFASGALNKGLEAAKAATSKTTEWVGGKIAQASKFGGEAVDTAKALTKTAVEKGKTVINAGKKLGKEAIETGGKYLNKGKEVLKTGANFVKGKVGQAMRFAGKMARGAGNVLLNMLPFGGGGEQPGGSSDASAGGSSRMYSGGAGALSSMISAPHPTSLTLPDSPSSMGIGPAAGGFAAGAMAGGGGGGDAKDWLSKIYQILTQIHATAEKISGDTTGLVRSSSMKDISSDLASAQLQGMRTEGGGGGGSYSFGGSGSSGSGGGWRSKLGKMAVGGGILAGLFGGKSQASESTTSPLSQEETMAKEILAEKMPATTKIAEKNEMMGSEDKSGKYSPFIVDKALGDTVKHFESGKAGAGAVSTGKGDAGGASYGTYQLASKTGTLQNFLKKSGYSDQFKGLTPGSSEFNAKWKEIAKSDPKFGEAQHEFIKGTHYDPQMKKLQKAGIDLSQKGKAVQESIWSTSVQFGGGTGLIEKALKGKDVSKMSDSEVVAAIQDYKIANNESLFKSSDPKTRAGTLKRANLEKSELLALANDRSSNLTPPPTQVASAPAQAKSVPKPTTSDAPKQNQNDNIKIMSVRNDEPSFLQWMFGNFQKV